MVWRWIWNLFHKWDNFFSSYFHNWKYFLKSCLTSEKYSIINVQNIEFSVYYIFYGFWTCFCQILDTECNIWRDITIWCENNTFDIFIVWKLQAVKISYIKNEKGWLFITIGTKLLIVEIVDIQWFDVKYKWNNFFSSNFHEWKYFKKSCLTSRYIFHN